MRHLLFIVLLLPAGAQAQVADSTRHALGIFTEMNTSSPLQPYPAVSTVGIVYKWRKKANVNYTATLGYSNRTFEEQVGGKRIYFNTSAQQWRVSDINMGVAGFGVERQRHFYKKVYFFAGLDGRVGYGSGTAKLVERQERWVPPTSSSSPPDGTLVMSEINVSAHDITMALLSVAPYIGAKLEFKRVTVGLNVMNYVRGEVYDEGSGQVTSFDINASNLYKRLFVTYKF